MPMLDDFDREITSLEERVFDLKKSNSAVLEEVMDLRRSVTRLRRISARQLEVLYRISHGEFPQIPEHILPYFRDVHDHLRRISDLSESYRDLISGLFYIHFSVIANRTNDVMKTLAVLSAIAYGKDADTQKSVQIALNAQKASRRLPSDRRQLYIDLVQSALSEAVANSRNPPSTVSPFTSTDGHGCDHVSARSVRPPA